VLGCPPAGRRIPGAAGAGAGTARPVVDPARPAAGSSVPRRVGRDLGPLDGRDRRQPGRRQRYLPAAGWTVGRPVGRASRRRAARPAGRLAPPPAGVRPFRAAGRPPRRRAGQRVFRPAGPGPDCRAGRTPDGAADLPGQRRGRADVRVVRARHRLAHTQRRHPGHLRCPRLAADLARRAGGDRTLGGQPGRTAARPRLPARHLARPGRRHRRIPAAAVVCRPGPAPLPVRAGRVQDRLCPVRPGAVGRRCGAAGRHGSPRAVDGRDRRGPELGAPRPGARPAVPDHGPAQPVRSRPRTGRLPRVLGLRAGAERLGRRPHRRGRAPDRAVRARIPRPGTGPGGHHAGRPGRPQSEQRGRQHRGRSL
jgi:hypothetical protein